MATYNANSFDKIEGLAVVRKRPNIYIGGVDSSGLMHLLWEALDNAVDEHIVGFGNKIIITLGADNSFQVEDFARGIPCDINDKTGETGLEMAFGLHSGGKFHQNAYANSGGLNGVGIAAVAALSTRTTSTVYQNKKKYVIEFKQGEIGTFDGEAELAKFTPKKGITTSPDKRSPAEKKERPTGTTIKWWADYDIFDTDEAESGRAEIDVSRIISRAQNTCYLCPGLTIVINDFRNPEKNEVHEFCYPNGFKDMLGNMSSTELMGMPIIFDGETSFVTKGVKKTVKVDIALQWEVGFDYHHASFVNIIETSLGGTHVTGTQNGLEESLLAAIESRGMRKAKEPIPEMVDIIEGLNLIVSIKLPEPGYSSQTKERLTESSVNGSVKRVVMEYMNDWLSARNNALVVKEILEKIMKAARLRKAKNAQFDVSDVLAETNPNSVFSSKPEKLKECMMVGDPRSSLMIVEGESALGTLYKARNAKYQALFPLKGKPQNVYDLSPERLFIPPNIKNPRTPAEKRLESVRKNFLDNGHILLQNKELDDLVKILGAGFGDSFDVEKMRYHDIILVADADVDGGHIEVLLIGFFQTYMPQVIEHGRLYLACPPLFVVKAGKESDPETLLASNDQELEALIAKCERDKKKIIHVARRKGHGESDAEEAFQYITNPGTRKLKKITIEDAQETAQMLNLLLGGEAALRKNWISLPRTRQLVSNEDLG